MGYFQLPLSTSVGLVTKLQGNHSLQKRISSERHPSIPGLHISCIYKNRVNGTKTICHFILGWAKYDPIIALNNK